VISLPKPKNWVELTAFQSVCVLSEISTKRSDMKQIARPENGASSIQSAVAYSFSLMKLGT